MALSVFVVKAAAVAWSVPPLATHVVVPAVAHAAFGAVPSVV
jgi:hypothetical protein